MVDTQKDFQTKRLLDMAEEYIPQFLAEFKRLNDMVLDILMNNIDELNKMVEELKEHNEIEDLEPVPVTPVVKTPKNVIDFHRIVED